MVLMSNLDENIKKYSSEKDKGGGQNRGENMAEEYKVSKKVLEENNIEIKKGSEVDINLGGEIKIKGKIAEIYEEDVKVVNE